MSRALAAIHLFAFWAILCAQPVITTVAGTDRFFRGGGQKATAVSLGGIDKVAVDLQGRTVFSDTAYNLVLRVESDGTVTVVAGNNVQAMAGSGTNGFSRSGGGFSGDGGPATSAALNVPAGIAFDTAGNLYIADAGNNRIRQVTPDGVISTVAGNGIAAFGGDNGPALAASFNSPTEVAVAPNGDLYVSDRGNRRIRRISQGVVTTVAGNGTEGSSPDGTPALSPIGRIEGLAFDPQGNLCFSEATNNLVRRIVNGRLATLAGTGTSGYVANAPVASSPLNQPFGIAFDRDGNLVIADTGNSRIRRILSGQLVDIAGTGAFGLSAEGIMAQTAVLNAPKGIAISPANAIVFADRDNFRVRRIDAQGLINTVAGDGKLLANERKVGSLLATLQNPFGVGVDLSGALLIADTDNNLVRRGNPDGTLSIVAGTGEARIGPDGGVAVSTALLSPFSAGVDSAGSLVITEAFGFFNNSGRVSRVDSTGRLAVIARGVANDNGLLTQGVVCPNGNVFVADYFGNRVLLQVAGGSQPLPFQGPTGLACDALSNLYVAEYGGRRILQLSPSFRLDVMAGIGSKTGTTADGGTSEDAKLNRPAGIAVDLAGNVYFTDAGDHLLRKITPGHVISTIAGIGQPGFSGDGGPAAAAALNTPWGVAVDRTGAIYVADVANNRIRKILVNAPPSFDLDQTSLSFNAISNGEATSAQTVRLTPSKLDLLLFTASADQPWVRVSPGAGSIPNALLVSADPAGLDPGTYRSKVNVTAPGANPGAKGIDIALTVAPPNPPKLEVDSRSVNFALFTTDDPQTRTVSIRNSGSGAVRFTASGNTDAGDGWLQVDTSGAVAPGVPGSVTLTVTPGGLAAGVYTGTVTLTTLAGDSTIQIPVALALTEPKTKLAISQDGISFAARAGGGAPLRRSFTVLNEGQGKMNWSASATALSGGSWLQITPASGTVNQALTDAQPVTVQVIPDGLAPGEYFGKVEVSSPGNPVRVLTVAFLVQDASADIAPDIYPSGLVFVGEAGKSPGSQTIQVANVTGSSFVLSTTRAPDSFFVQTPSAVEVQPNAPVSIVVQPDYSKLAPGTYRSTLTLTSGGVARKVAITGIVTDPGAATAKSGRRSACGSSVLQVTILAPQDRQTVLLNQSVTLQAKVTDACGAVFQDPSLKVNASFSNHDPFFPLKVADPARGLYSGSWTPKTNATTVEVSIQADSQVGGGFGSHGNTSVFVTIGAVSRAPVILPPSVRNGASFKSDIPIAPGSYISIFGSKLADGTSSVPGGDLPGCLAGTCVTLSGTPLPVSYVSDGQLNVVVPYQIDTNQELKVLIQRGEALSTSEALTVAPALPAIFTKTRQPDGSYTDGPGSGQGAINGPSGVLADSSAPVKAGDQITIYCTGLGAVNNAPPLGAVTPPSPPATTVLPVRVTIGGVDAPVSFSGLDPGAVSRYKVIATVPAGVATGDAEVRMTVGTLTSAGGVTIAVR